MTSRQIDCSVALVGREMDEVVLTLYRELSGHLTYERPRLEALIDQLRVLLGNLITVELQSSRGWLRVPHSPNAYRYIEGVHPYGCSYRQLKALIVALIGARLIEVRGGSYNRTNGKGRLTRLRMRQALIDRLEAQAVALSNTSISQPIDLVVLKDNNKHPVPYPVTQRVLEMRRHLRRYNELLETHRITLEHLTPEEEGLLRERAIDLGRTRYRRVFNNGSFEQGGRFFDPWWQQVARALRIKILIDDHATVELDYSAMNMHLLYSKERLAYADVHGADDDPYSVPGHETVNRAILKKVMLASVGANSRASAIRAARLALMQLGLYKKGMDLEGITDAFQRKHAPIGHQLFQGLSPELQFQESRVAETIIQAMTEREIPVLNIHDGFICTTDVGDELEGQMTQAFVSLGLSSTPKISRT
jgi:hypothetical protein